jgi:hypothetical protein
MQVSAGGYGHVNHPQGLQSIQLAFDPFLCLLSFGNVQHDPLQKNRFPVFIQHMKHFIMYPSCLTVAVK